MNLEEIGITVVTIEDVSDTLGAIESLVSTNKLKSKVRSIVAEVNKLSDDIQSIINNLSVEEREVLNQIIDDMQYNDEWEDEEDEFYESEEEE